MQGGFKGSRYDGDPFDAAIQDGAGHEADTKKDDAVELPFHGHPHTVGFPIHSHVRSR